jgi:hypothetical protein
MAFSVVFYFWRKYKELRLKTTFMKIARKESNEKFKRALKTPCSFDFLFEKSVIGYIWQFLDNLRHLTEWYSNFQQMICKNAKYHCVGGYSSRKVCLYHQAKCILFKCCDSWVS